MAHPNEELYRTGFEAFQKGDMDTLKNHLADDIVWHVAGRDPFAGDYKGMGEVLVCSGSR
jgi:uncharacterized protein